MSATADLVVHMDYARFDTYIGRGKGSVWGNPFIIGRDGTRAEVIEKYAAWLRKQPQLVARLPELRGKVLGCHCKPDPCHGDVLAAWANQGQKVAIVGSRDFPYLALVRRYVAGLAPGTVIVSGGARGVDREGELAAYEAGFGVKIFFADWKGFGKAAGPMRNGEIAREADQFAIFWDGFSPGTMNMLGLARAAKKPVELFTYRRAPRGVSDNPGVLQPLRWPFARPEAPAPKTAAQAAARARRGRG